MSKKKSVEEYPDGRVPETGGEQKLPVIESMSYYITHKYLLAFYSYLNKMLRNGTLADTVGFCFSNRIINRETVKFARISYRRLDWHTFFVSREVTLFLTTREGIRTWQGYITASFDANCESGFKFEMEDLCPVSEYDYDDLPRLTEYLIPVMSYREMDEEAERIWNMYLPGALNDLKQRDAIELAKRVGLSISYLPLKNHRSVKSIMFFSEDTVTVDASPNSSKSITVKVAAKTIVINLNNRWKDLSPLNVYHEIIHYLEHYLFFRLQEMSSNDPMRIKTYKNQDEKAENEILWAETQARRCSFGLLMPKTDFMHRYNNHCDFITEYRHSGEKYEKICDELSEELNIPDFLIKTRLIQQGHILAKGAVNYIDGKRIRPFSFDSNELKSSDYSFVIPPKLADKLYLEDKEYRNLIDSRKYIYVDGLVVRNNPQYVVYRNSVPVLTDWAIANVDMCCLRFKCEYVQINVGQYDIGRMYCDNESLRRIAFFLEDTMKEKGVDELEAWTIYEKEFPETFEDAVNYLMRKNGMNRDDLAEKLYMEPRTLDRWLKNPDTKITADFVMAVILVLRVPDGISENLFTCAHIQLDRRNRRHVAFLLILRKMWMDGIDAANTYLKSKNLDIITYK